MHKGKLHCDGNKNKCIFSGVSVCIWLLKKSLLYITAL